MFKHKRIFLKRIASCLCLIVFLFQQIRADSLAWALADAEGSGTRSSVPGWSPQEVLSSLQIPEKFGQIQETFFSPQASSSGEPLIVYLQSAHANYDSESHVKELIHYFQEKYALPLVLLEGGEGKLDALFFQSFPEAELREKILDKYLKDGELSGGEVASIQGDSFDTDYYGIETQSLYAENKKAFVSAIENENAIRLYLDRLERKLESESAKSFSRSSLFFHEKQKAFHAETLNLLEYIKALKGFLSSQETASFSSRYPELFKLLAAEEEETRFKKEDFDPFMSSFLQTFRSRLLPSLSKQEKMEMGQLIQNYQTGQTGPDVLIKKIQALAESQKFPLEIPQALMGSVSHAESLSLIKGTRLFEELETLENFLIETLPTSAEEKATLRKFEMVELLRDFSKLEIAHNKWEFLKDQSAGGLLKETDASGLDRLFAPHFEFYKRAVQRDEILFRNILRAAKGKKAKLALIVTGGFHREGITRRFKETNVPFVVITPRINKLDDKEVYVKAMEDKASYMRYYRGNLWEALANDYAAKLAASLKASELTPSLKKWRDRIIQNAVAEGRVTQVSLYTKYIDALVQSIRKEMEKENGVEKLSYDVIRRHLEKEGLDSFRALYFDQFRNTARQKWEIFKNGLQEVWDKKDFSPSSVQKLFQTLSVVNGSQLAVAIALIRNPGSSEFQIPLEKTGLPSSNPSLNQGEQLVRDAAAAIAAKVASGEFTTEQVVMAEAAVKVMGGFNPVLSELSRLFPDAADAEKVQQVFDLVKSLAAPSTANSIGAESSGKKTKRFQSEFLTDIEQKELGKRLIQFHREMKEIFKPFQEQTEDPALYIVTIREKKRFSSEFIKRFEFYLEQKQLPKEEAIKKAWADAAQNIYLDMLPKKEALVSVKPMKLSEPDFELAPPVKTVPKPVQMTKETRLVTEAPAVKITNEREKTRQELALTLAGHTGHVYSVQTLEEEGRLTVVSGSADKTIKIWAEKKDNPEEFDVREFTLPGSAGAILSVQVFRSPDGQLKIVSTSEDGTLRVWEQKKGKEEEFAVRILKTDGPLLRTKVFQDASGRLTVVGGNQNGALKILEEKPDGTFEERTIPAHDGMLIGIDAIRDVQGRLTIVSTGKDATVRVWKQTDGSSFSVETLSGHEAPVLDAQLIPRQDGTVAIVTASRDKTIRVWQKAQTSLTYEMSILESHTDEVLSVRGLEKDGKLIIVSGSKDKTVKIWEEQGGPEGRFSVKTLTGHTAGIASLNVLVDEKGVLTIVSGANFEDSSVKIWKMDAEDRVPSQTVKGEETVSDLLAVQDAYEKLDRAIDSGVPTLFVRPMSAVDSFEQAIQIKKNKDKDLVTQTLTATPFTDRAQLIGALMPVSKKESEAKGTKEQLRFEKGILYRMIELALLHPERTYLLTIDQIEALPPKVRAQLNQFLLTGELQLPEIGEKIKLPKNLRIIATVTENAVMEDSAFYDRFLRKQLAPMNDADIALILRARFQLPERVVRLLIRSYQESSFSVPLGHYFTLASYISGRLKDGSRDKPVSETRAFDIAKKELELFFLKKDVVYNHKVTFDAEKKKLFIDKVELPITPEIAEKIRRRMEDSGETNPLKLMKSIFKEEAGLTVTNDVLRALSALARNVRYGNRTIRLEGPTGTGKTFIAQALAKLMGIPFYGEPIHDKSKQSKWLGVFRPTEEGDYVLDSDTPFLKVLKEGGVIALSELNTAVKDGTAKLGWWLIPLARGDSALNLNEYPRAPDGEKIGESFDRAPNSIVIMDINPSESYEARGKLPPMLDAFAPAVWIGGNLSEAELKEIALDYLGGLSDRSSRVYYAELLAKAHFNLQEELRKESRKLSPGEEHVLTLRELKRAAEMIVQHAKEKSVYNNFLAAFRLHYAQGFKDREDQRIVMMAADDVLSGIGVKLVRNNYGVYQYLSDDSYSVQQLPVKDPQAVKVTEGAISAQGIVKGVKKAMASSELVTAIDERKEVISEQALTFQAGIAGKPNRNQVVELKDRILIVTVTDEATLKIYEQMKGDPSEEVKVLTYPVNLLPEKAGVKSLQVLVDDQGRVTIVTAGSDSYLHIFEETAPGSREFKTRSFPSVDIDITTVKAIRQDGKLTIGLGSKEGKVKILEEKMSGFVTRTLEGHSGDVNGLELFRENGQLFIVSVSSDKTVRTWEQSLVDPEKFSSNVLEGHQKSVRAVRAFRENGRFIIVSGGEDRTVRIWKESKSKPGAFSATTLKGHFDSVVDLEAFREEGRTVIISAGKDRTLRMWQERQDKKGEFKRKILRGHADPLETVSAVKTGQGYLMVSSDKAGEVRMWKDDEEKDSLKPSDIESFVDESLFRSGLPTLLSMPAEQDPFQLLDTLVREKHPKASVEVEKIRAGEFLDDFSLFGGYVIDQEAEASGERRFKWADGIIPRMIKAAIKAEQEDRDLPENEKRLFVLAFENFHYLKPKLAVALNALLQEGTFYSPLDKRPLQVPKNLRFFATASIESELKLSLAEQSRWVRVHSPETELVQEKKASKKKVTHIIKVESTYQVPEDLIPSGDPSHDKIFRPFLVELSNPDIDDQRKEEIINPDFFEVKMREAYATHTWDSAFIMSLVMKLGKSADKQGTYWPLPLAEFFEMLLKTSEHGERLRTTKMDGYILSHIQKTREAVETVVVKEEESEVLLPLGIQNVEQLNQSFEVFDPALRSAEEDLLVPTVELIATESEIVDGWKQGKRITILEGDPGGGKTDIAVDIANRFGLPSFIFSSHGRVHLQDFIGNYTQDEQGRFILTAEPYKGDESDDSVKNGKDHYRIPFLEYVAHGGVFVIDEGAIGKRSQALIAWLTGLARGETTLVINEHPGREPIEINVSKNFHIVVTTNKVDETPGRETLPSEILKNSKRIEISNKFQQESYRAILNRFYNIFYSGKKALPADIQTSIDLQIKLQQEMQKFIELESSLESPDKHLFTLRDLKNWTRALLAEYAAGKDWETAFRESFGLFYLKQFPSSERGLALERIRAGVSEVFAAQLESSLQKKPDDKDQFAARLRNKEGIPSEEAVQKDLQSVLDLNFHALLFLRPGSREKEILDRFAEKEKYDTLHLEGLPEMTIQDLLGGLFPVLEGEEAPAGRELLWKPGFLSRHQPGQGKKLLVLHNIDALPEKVRAALNNFLLKGYLELTDAAGKTSQYKLPSDVKIVATLSSESQREFSSAFYNRFVKVDVPAIEVRNEGFSETLQALRGEYGLSELEARRVQQIYLMVKSLEEEGELWPSGKHYHFSVKDALLHGQLLSLAKKEAADKGGRLDQDQIKRLIATEALRIYGGALAENELDYKTFRDMILKSIFPHELVEEISGTVTRKDNLVESFGDVKLPVSSESGVAPEDMDPNYRLNLVSAIVKTLSGVVRGWQAGKGVALAGETGAAKTTMGAFLAELMGLEAYIYSTHGESKASDLTVTPQMTPQGTYRMQIKEFTERIQKGNQVIIIDEANIRPEVLWVLNGIARGEKEFTVELPGKDPFKVSLGKNVFFLFTMNPETYAGRGEIPQVLLENIMRLWAPVDYPENELEAIVESFLSTAQTKLLEKIQTLDQVNGVLQRLTIDEVLAQVEKGGHDAVLQLAETQKDELRALEREILARPDVREKMAFIRSKAKISAKDVNVVFSMKTWWAQAMDGKTIFVPLYELVNPKRSAEAVVGLIIHEIRHKRYSVTDKEMEQAAVELHQETAMKHPGFHTLWNYIEDPRIDLMKDPGLEGENQYILQMLKEFFIEKKPTVEAQLEMVAQAKTAPHAAFMAEILRYSYTGVYSEVFEHYPDDVKEAVRKVVEVGDQSLLYLATQATPVLLDFAGIEQGEKGSPEERRKEKVRAATESLKVLTEKIFPIFEELYNKAKEKQLPPAPGGMPGGGKGQKGEGQQGEGAGEQGEGQGKEKSGQGKQTGGAKKGAGQQGPSQSGSQQQPGEGAQGAGAPRFQPLSPEEIEKMLEDADQGGLPQGVTPEDLTGKTPKEVEGDIDREQKGPQSGGEGEMSDEERGALEQQARDAVKQVKERRKSEMRSGEAFNSRLAEISPQGKKLGKGFVQIFRVPDEPEIEEAPTGRIINPIRFLRNDQEPFDEETENLGKPELALLSVIDTSGSMSRYVPALKRMLAILMDSFQEIGKKKAEYGISFITDLYDSLKGFKEKYTVNDLNQKQGAMEGWMDRGGRLSPGTGIHIFNAVQGIIDEFKVSQKKNKIALILTDGQDTGGDLRYDERSRAVPSRRLREKLNEARKLGIDIVGIGFASTPDVKVFDHFLQIDSENTDMVVEALLKIAKAKASSGRLPANPDLAAGLGIKGKPIQRATEKNDEKAVQSLSVDAAEQMLGEPIKPEDAASSLGQLAGNGLAAPEVGKRMEDAVFPELERRLAAKQDELRRVERGTLDDVAKRLIDEQGELSSEMLWTLFSEESGLSLLPAPSSAAFDAWTAGMLNLFPSSRGGSMGTDNFQARDEETARAVLDAIRSVSEKTVIEFRMPRHWEGIDAENRALMMEELLRTIRDTVILNPLFTVRIVAASSAEKSQLTRALGKLSNRENQRFIAGKILIETARLSTLTPNTIVSDQAQSVLQEIQTSGKSETLVFDAGFYADGKTPIQFNQKVGPAQLFLATAAALSQKTVDGLSKLESMIKVQSEQALTSFALAIQLLVEQAEAASKVAEAA